MLSAAKDPRAADQLTTSLGLASSYACQPQGFAQTMDLYTE